MRDLAEDKPRLVDGLLNPGIRRLAKSELKRHKARTALIFLLIFAAAVLSLGQVAGVNNGLAVDDNATGMTAVDEDSAAALVERVQPERVEMWKSLFANGVALSEQPLLQGLPDSELRGRPVGPNQEYVVIEGRAPSSIDEVVVDELTAQARSWQVGETVEVQGQLRVVTGIAKGLGFTERTLFLVPDSLEGGRIVGNVWFADAAEVGREGVVDARGLGESAAIHPFDSNSSEQLGATVFSSIGLMAIAATISAAAWTVGFQRRLRLVALANVIGAEPAHLRRGVVLQAVWISTGAFVGAWIVVASLTIAYNRFGDVFSTRTSMLAPQSVVLVGAIVIGMSMFAAWLPIRSLRLGAAEAGLAGRTTNQKARVRSFTEGLGLIALGLFFLNRTIGRDNLALMVQGVLGVGALMAGAILALPWILESLAALASRPVGRRAPTARLAFRDLIRSRQRSLGLILTIGAVVVMATAGLADNAQANRENAQSRWENENFGEAFTVSFGELDSMTTEAYTALELLEPISISIYGGMDDLPDGATRTIIGNEPGTLAGEGLFGHMRFEKGKRSAVEALNLNGITIESKPEHDRSSGESALIFKISLGFLAGVLMLLGLLRRSEDGEKRAALYSLGVRPSVFRSTAFWSGASAGLVAVVIGIPLGIAAHGAAEANYPRFTVPWLELGVLGIAVPLLAGLIGALVTPGPGRSRAQWLESQAVN